MPKGFIDIPNSVNPTDPYWKMAQQVLDSLKTTGQVPPPETQPVNNDKALQDEYNNMAEKTYADRAKTDTEQALNDKVKNGWYSPDVMNPGGTGGAPQTVQEEDWIKNFIKTNGRKPSGEEVGKWVHTQDTSNWNYTATSTMGKLGFKTPKEWMTAQSSGENYGPWAGNLVPEGGYVVKDANGQPYLRTYNQQKAGGFGGGIIPGDTSANYPSYDKTFHNPPEDVLSLTDDLTVYQARLTDWLDRMVGLDTPKITDAKNKQQDIVDELNTQINNLSDQLTLGTIKSNEFNQKSIDLKNAASLKVQELQNFIDTAWTKTKASDALNEAQSQMGQGDVSTLPFYLESQNVTGQAVTALMQSLYQGAFDTETNRIKNIPTFGGYESDKVKAPTGTEKVDFSNYVQGLDTGNNWKAWLVSQYGDYYNQWLQSDRKLAFMDWVRNYLSGGA
jgi:hypothetical protein